MATKAKLYLHKDLSAPRIIQPETWTPLRFDKAIRNDRNMVRNLMYVVPPETGDFIWSRAITWSGFQIPPGDTRPRQFMSRFMRELTDDDTGTDSELDTPGKDWDMATWQFDGVKDQLYCVEVYHDHSDVAQIEHAQFVACTWDY